MPTMTFTEGADTYTVVGSQAYTLEFLGGNDTLTVSAAAGSSTTAHMGTGSDLVRLQSGQDVTVFGEAGDDRFEIDLVHAVISGGDGDDKFSIHAGGTFRGGAGADRFDFLGAALDTSVYGNDGNDVFLGRGQVVAGAIYGGPGDDVFNNFTATVSLLGGTGNDRYVLGKELSIPLVENFGEGIDTVQLAAGLSYTLPSNVENLAVVALPWATNDYATLAGNTLANQIVGSANDDGIQGMAGDDRLYGQNGDDHLFGLEGNDVIVGGGGDDTLIGYTGDDSMRGGKGNDTYYVSDIGDSVVENAGEGTDDVYTSLTGYTLPGAVEIGHITLSGGATLNGNFGSNKLYGGGGDDYLNGGFGNDELSGGDGHNVLSGGPGDDILHGSYHGDYLSGGQGNDIYLISSGDVVDESGGDGIDLVRITGATVTVQLADGIENAELLAQQSPQNGWGVFGNALDNAISGTDFADQLFGAAGNDTLTGNAGNDVLGGGLGADNLSGGADSDRFVYSQTSDSTSAAYDTITDFQTALDQIDLKAIDANIYVAGDQAFNTNGTSTNTAGDLWIAHYGGVGSFNNYMIYGDTNGDGNADFQLLVHLASGTSDQIVIVH